MDVERIVSTAQSQWGVSPPRKSITLVRQRKRKWRRLPTVLVREGDTVVDMGTVREVSTVRADDEIVQMWWTTGEGDRSQIAPHAMVKVFTEVDMRYAKMGDGETVHIASFSMSQDGFGSTLCGREGSLTLVADENVEKVCARCNKAAGN